MNGLQVSSLLATSRAYGFDAFMTRAELGEAGRVCELYIGTMSGGMDQAISAMGNVSARHASPHNLSLLCHNGSCIF